MTIKMYDGPVGGLALQNLGDHVEVHNSEGTLYEGALSYLSFDATRDEEERVAIALTQDDDPANDKVFYLRTTHRVRAT